MPNKHFCQGPTCHEQVTQDRFLKSRGVVRGRYAYANLDINMQRNKIKYLEDRIATLEKTLESHAKILARFQMTEGDNNA